MTARWGAGGTGAFLVGTCACLWLAARVPRMLGGLAGMPARAADSATATARQYAVHGGGQRHRERRRGPAGAIQETGPAVGSGTGAERGAPPTARPHVAQPAADPRAAAGPAPTPRRYRAPTWIDGARSPCE